VRHFSYGAMAVLALLPAACGSRRLDAAAALAEMTDAFNEGTKALKTVADEVTAKEAAARLEPHAKKFEAAARDYKYSVRRDRSRGDLNAELQKNLKATMAFMAETNRVERIPGAMRHLKPLIDRMDEALQEEE
jgi:hypothetical protein